MQRELIEKLQKTVDIINNSPGLTNVMVEFYIPNEKILERDFENSERPYILLTYLEDEYSANTRKISLGTTALHSTPEDLSMHVMQAITEFRDEIDDIIMG